MECALQHKLIPAAALGSSSHLSQWYRNGRVLYNAAFVEWWVMKARAYLVKGMGLDQWRNLAVQQQKLPVELCGSTAIPSPRPSI